MTTQIGDPKLTLTDTQINTAEVAITVTLNGIAKTFTARAQTEGSVAGAASSLLFAVRDDAGKWAHETGRQVQR